MNKEQWINYNRDIITGAKLGVKDGTAFNTLLNRYLSSRSDEIHHSFLYGFTDTDSYGKLLNDFCYKLSSTESLMLGIMKILDNSDAKDNYLLRHNAESIKKVISMYFKHNVKDSNALRKFHDGLGK